MMQAIFRRLANRLVGILLWVVGFFFFSVDWFLLGWKTTVKDASSFCHQETFYHSCHIYTGCSSLPIVIMGSVIEAVLGGLLLQCMHRASWMCIKSRKTHVK